MRDFSMGEPNQDSKRFDRRTIIGSLGSLATVSVAGCGGDGVDGGDGSDGGDGGDGSDGGDGGDGGDGCMDTTLYFWNWHTSESDNRIINDQVSEFEDETGVTVEQVVHESNSYETPVRNAIRTGADNAPDVYQMYTGPPRMGPFVENEHTLPVEEQFDADFFERFLEVNRNQVRYQDRDLSTWGNPDGAMHAVPSRIASVNMFYNKTVLADAGVDPSSLEHRMDVTWEEFLDICSQVSDAGYDPIIAGNRNQWVIGHYISIFMMKAVGVENYLSAGLGRGDVSFTDSDVVESMSRLQLLMDEGYINTDHNSLTMTESATLFGDDQAAFFHAGTAFNPASVLDDSELMPDPVDYMWFPYFPDLYAEGQNEATGQQTDCYIINTDAQERGNTEAAAQFLEHIMSVDNRVQWLEETLTFPGMPEVYVQAELTPSNRVLVSALDQMQNADRVGPVFDLAFPSEITNELLNVGQALAEGEDPEELMAGVQSVAEEVHGE
jgi:ABC-type glycerol-3-phosphate transport system substrate-binding protein